MDVDLSTDLRALLPLVAPLLSGHSDVAIGTRLAPRRAGRARRQARADLARLQPAAAHRRCGARFSDAQCGFKAVRADAARRLLPRVRDEGWFFDTELLVLAQREGLRIHEVPVDWVDDPDSRVDIVAHRARRPARHRAPAGRARRPRASSASASLSTLAYALLYLAAARPARRRGRQRARAGDHRGRQHAGQPPPHLRRRAAAATSCASTRWARSSTSLTLGLTSGALAVLHGLDRDPAPGRSSWRCWSRRASAPPSPATSRCGPGSSPAAARRAAPGARRCTAPPTRKEPPVSTVLRSPCPARGRAPAPRERARSPGRRPSWPRCWCWPAVLYLWALEPQRLRQRVLQRGRALDERRAGTRSSTARSTPAG